MNWSRGSEQRIPPHLAPLRGNALPNRALEETILDPAVARKARARNETSVRRSGEPRRSSSGPGLTPLTSAGRIMKPGTAVPIKTAVSKPKAKPFQASMQPPMQAPIQGPSQVSLQAPPQAPSQAPSQILVQHITQGRPNSNTSQKPAQAQHQPQLPPQPKLAGPAHAKFQPPGQTHLHQAPPRQSQAQVRLKRGLVAQGLAAVTPVPKRWSHSNNDENRADVPSSRSPSIEGLPNPMHSPTLPIIEGHQLTSTTIIGKGGYSYVYRATDKTLGKLVAVKMVLQGEAGPHMRHQLGREIDLLKSLRGVGGVVQLLAHTVTDDVMYMILELGDMDLYTIMKGRRHDNVALDIEFVRYWGGQVLRCVAAVHERNIVHADLKPANFLVVQGALKLIDFGISDELPEHTMGLHRLEQVGTLSYMAPETVVLEPSHHDTGHDYKVTKASDMWSCGCILFEMVYAKRPLSAANQRKLMQTLLSPSNIDIVHAKTGEGGVAVPLGLHEVVRGCLDVNPATRLTSAQAVHSLFFAPKSIDYAFVEALMRNSIEFGRSCELHNKQPPPEEIAKYTNTAWARVMSLNSG